MPKGKRIIFKPYIRTWGSAWGPAKVHLVGDNESTPHCMNRSIHGEAVETWPVDALSASGAEPLLACKKCFPDGKPNVKKEKP